MALSLGVYLILHPGNWIEINGFLFSFKRDSDIPRKLIFNLYSVISSESSTKWIRREESLSKKKRNTCLCF